MNHQSTRQPGARATSESAPKHGGDIHRAAQHYNIAHENWLDLSTGINPDPYPIPTIPASCFHRLPDEHTQSMLAAASTYYQTEYLVAGAGSQAFIELLPTLRKPTRVAVPRVGYTEHAWNWQRQGHQLVWYDGFKPQDLERTLARPDIECAVLINPNNPTAASLSHRGILHCQQTIAKRRGWLIIDGAFVDAMESADESARYQYSNLPGVIELRSLGKFFGLAGIRVGFALANAEITKQLSSAIGVWSITSVSQFVAATALKDKSWQVEAQRKLRADSAWMLSVLKKYFVNAELFSTPFFVSVLLPLNRAIKQQDRLARHGIWTRLWPLANGAQALLRFGLIAQKNQAGRSQFADLHQ